MLEKCVCYSYSGVLQYRVGGGEWFKSALISRVLELLTIDVQS